MPDGRVLTYQRTGQVDVWDPAEGLSGGHLTLPNDTGTNPFCSSLLVLPGGGGVFIAGGGSSDSPDSTTNVYNYQDDAITRNADMKRPRWYSTSTTLLDGRTYIQGGTGGTDHPEIRDTDGTFALLSGADTDDLLFAYPRNFLAPDGRVFGFDGNGKMYYVSTAGSGSVANMGQFGGPTGRDSSSAMYRPGRILQFGGASSGALIIDINGGAPSVATTASLSTKRRLATATILADGTVLATGGSEVRNELVGVNYSAEIWNPSTEQWKRGALADRARLYHSMALLLPDASVLVAGGGSPGPQNNNNAEIYYPPYLYDSSGGWADRPVIDDSPSFIEVGQTFRVDMAAGRAADRIVLIKTGAVTHSFNMEQRFIELTYQATGNRLLVSAPARATEAPPGFYLLFAIDAAGTPSIGKILRIGVASTPDPDVVPSLDNPGNQAGEVGVPIWLPLTATDPNGDELTFGASGLPPGLALDPLSGVISGVLDTAGNFDVAVTASDGVNTASIGFTWSVASATGAFVLKPPPTPAPVEVGAEIELAASASGESALLYKWDFDDGTPETPYGESATISHAFSNPGIYYVTVTAVSVDGGLPQTTTVVVKVHLPLTAVRPDISTPIALETLPGGGERLWVVNPDNDSVSAFDTELNSRIAEIPVGAAPRTLAVLPNGEIWVANRGGGTISVIDSASLAVVRTIGLPFASQPYGVVATRAGGAVFVSLDALGRLLRIDSESGAVTGSVDVGPHPRHLAVTGDGNRVYVSRYMTRPLPGESTANVTPEIDGNPVGGEVVVVNAGAMTIRKTIVLRHSERPDFEMQGRGIPNYLGAMAISPDGRSAWVPSKQDNLMLGTLRNGLPLTFENTVRAISSRVDLGGETEDYPARLDHDDSGVASAIAFDTNGIYMFVALESSREVAVVDAYGDLELFRVNAGHAPQGLAFSTENNTLYVSNFMDRTVGVYDTSTLLAEGIANVPLIATMSTVGTERLAAQVLQGKRLFYDARDARLAKDRYLSCASCHNDGEHDGRVWDLTGQGEGLRNTISLRGRGGAQGFLHWSNNFDEVQDFEGQIRSLAGGTGLMTSAQFSTGTRSQPLGDPKRGVSADLDALAAYVASLDAFAASPYRNADGSPTASALAGRQVFIDRNCASCHGGTAFTISAGNNPRDVGTLTAASGKRLNGALTGIDVPTLRDVWATAPYLHLGSAATLGDAILAHSGVTLTANERTDLVAYVQQIGSQEPSAPAPDPPPPPPATTGTGLAGVYFNNKTLSGTPVLQRVEVVNFSWSTNSPGKGVNKDNFSVRWSGKFKAPASGAYKFRTVSNDGVRLTVNGVRVIDAWTNRSSSVTKTSAAITLKSGQSYAITMEFYDNTGAAVAQLKWLRPGKTSYATVPKANLYPE